MEMEDDVQKKRQIDTELHDDDLDQQAKARAFENEEEEQKAMELINQRKDAEFNRLQAEARRKIIPI